MYTIFYFQKIKICYIINENIRGVFMSKYETISTQKQKKEFIIDSLKSTIIFFAMTMIGYLFQKLHFSEANIITIYILGVLITAITTTHKIYSYISSIANVFMFNFLFTDPYFTFKVNDPGNIITFFIMFFAAFITSNLTVQIKQNAIQSAQTAHRTQILLETNQMLQQAKDKIGIMNVTCQQLMKLLNKDILFYPVGKDLEKSPFTYSVYGDKYIENCVYKNEFNIVNWVYQNHQSAGATTQLFSEAKHLYLLVKNNDKIYGIVGIKIQEPLDSFEMSIALSILGEAALALESEKANKEKADADLLAKNEQLRANLLRSISHDLRTPLTSISGNASILLSKGQSLTEDKKNILHKNIYDDSLWLIHLVENLLSVTRIEDGSMKLNMTTELIDEVINEALQHVSREKSRHHISFTQDKEFILVKMDAHLIMQVIINLIDNAIKYTPQDSHISIHVSQQNKNVIIDVADNGLGISDDIKPHIFDMFYTGDMTVVDSSRSLGLGLALCKSIMNAHDGSIEILDNYPHGSLFRLTLPIKEVQLHES